MKKLQKFIGKIYWISPCIYSSPNEIDSITYVADIIRAIKIDDKFNMEWSSRELDTGGIKLTSSDNINYSGILNYEENQKNYLGKIPSACFYENKAGCLLIGKWLSEGELFTFIVELKKVDKFPDEKK